MIVIAQPYVNFKESVTEDSLESAARHLLLLGEEKAREFYSDRLNDAPISIEADIEIGSTKTWIAFSTVATVLVFYGDIRQSADYLIKDAKYIGEVIIPNVGNAIGISSQPAVKQRRLGLPGQVHRLFEAVDRHELTPEEATDRAIAIFDRYERNDMEVENKDMIAGKLNNELKQAYRDGHDNPRKKPVPALPPEQPTIYRPRSGVRVSRNSNGEIEYHQDNE